MLLIVYSSNVDRNTKEIRQQKIQTTKDILLQLNIEDNGTH